MLAWLELYSNSASLHRSFENAVCYRKTREHALLCMHSLAHDTDSRAGSEGGDYDDIERGIEAYPSVMKWRAVSS